MLRTILDRTEQAKRPRRADPCGPPTGSQVAHRLLDPRNGPAFDLSNAGPLCRAYVVLSTPRTASTLLCRTLWDTGRVGAPKEYCNAMQLRDWTVRFGSSGRARAVSALPGRVLPIWERACSSHTRGAHLSRVLRHRTSETGMFGLKLQPDQLTRWFGTLATLQLALGPLQFIRLRRGDRHAQVDSFAHAIHTGQWSATDTPSRIRLPVSRRWAEREIDRQERQLDRLIRGVPVHTVTTEALVTNFESTLRSVLAFLGDTADAPLPPPGQHQQVRD